MNAFRNKLMAAGLALAAWSVVGAAAESAPPPVQGQDFRTRGQEFIDNTVAQLRRQGDSVDLQRRLEEARRRLEAAASEVANLSGMLGRNFVEDDIGPPPRSLLGVMFNRTDQKDGVLVSEVSPGGAAAEAGIKAGDIITSIGGRDLTKEGDPGRMLVETMQQVEPNVKLQVGVLRDGKKMSFDVMPRPAPARVAGNIMQWPEANGPGTPFERRVEIRTVGEGPDDGARFAGLEFATLSEKLGSYFGVKSGVLVVRAGGNPAFKLQDGDVILAIDGREPTSAQHAGRILRSYGNGEKLKLRVQRDRKAQDIEITMSNLPSIDSCAAARSWCADSRGVPPVPQRN